MVSISDVHLAIAFTLPPKLLIHLNIKRSLSRDNWLVFSDKAAQNAGNFCFGLI